MKKPKRKKVFNTYFHTHRCSEFCLTLFLLQNANAQATIEANLANINMRPEDLTKVFDPLFHMMSGKFDAGGARGMLMHNLNVSTSAGIIFDSVPPADTDGADTLGEEAFTSTVSTSIISKLQGINVSTKKSLCPEFDQFSQAMEADLDAEPSEAPGSQANDDDEIESDAEDNYMDDDDNDADMGMDEYDEASQARSRSLSPSQQIGAHEARPAHRPTWNQMVCALDDGINFSDEYAFFGKKLQSSWAGGSGSWKPSERRVAKDDAKKKRAEKVAFIIDFDTVNEMDFGTSFDLPASAGVNRLSENAIEKSLEGASSLLLPSDHQYQPDQLVSLFLRRNKKVKRFTATNKVVANGEGEQAYNYSNSADNNYVAPQDFDDDGFEGGFDDDDDFEAGGESQATGFDMVDAPNKVAQIDVHYERTAKKLDVKLLKQGMWGNISEEAPKSEDPLLFTNVLKDIPLSQEQASSVSVPFCFICLLHLANEKTLELHNSTDLSQLTITA